MMPGGPMTRNEMESETERQRQNRSVIDHS